MPKKIPFGIKLFGVLLILSSLIQMPGFIDYGRYRHGWFRQLPEGLILLRFLVSWLIRLAGLACGIGILKRKEFFRKAALGLFFFTIITINLKHPYFVFANIFKDATKSISDNPAISYSVKTRSIELLTSLMPITAVIMYVGDILFALCIIYYFTRPKVKQYFIK